MYQYTASQWLIFFFWYCFLGWVWESCYVSVKNGVRDKKFRWVNRGFLHGPALPIYGFAAIAILVATIEVKDNIWLIFLFGAGAATSLELVTGSTMEWLFHVKYWDYSNLPLNFDGYICPFISLFWGFLSVIMVKVIHVPAETVVSRLPLRISEIVALVLTGLSAFDFSESFREAWDMRELLEKLTETREAIQRLENRLDAVVAFPPKPDVEGLRERTGNARQKASESLEKLRESRKRWLEELSSRTNRHSFQITKHLRRNPGVISGKYADALKEIRGLFEEK